MGQGKEAKTAPDPAVEIQEKGEIFFFYRPKVDREEAHSPDDVQRMYVVLRPESAGDRAVEDKQAPDSGKEGNKKQRRHDDHQGGHEQGKQGSSQGGHGKEEVNVEKQLLLRLIVMGKKSLPDPAKRGRPYWGHVDLVTTNIDDIKEALKEEEYTTATRGPRHRPAARALGEGVYRILKHDSGSRVHTHLIYKLELPSPSRHKHHAAEQPQEDMHVEPEASFLIQIKNPDQPAGGGERFRGLQSKRRAVFPAHLQGRFGSNRYAAADPPDLLNYEGCEFLLISASDDVEEELGLELQTETETETGCGDDDGDRAGAGAGCSDLVKMFGDVADVKPLLSRSWD